MKEKIYIDTYIDQTNRGDIRKREVEILKGSKIILRNQMSFAINTPRP